jgi:hypothetical protein
MKKSFFKILSIGILFSSITACADAPKKVASQEDEEVIEEAQVEEEVIEEDNSFMLPSPIQIAAIFNRAGLGFRSGLTNPPQNLSKYNTKTSKYLNFGVYSADLAYVVLNDQQQASIDYLNAVKVLSEEIGMPGIFGTGELFESFEKNVGNQDTILRILTVIKRRTDEYLEENSEKSKEAIFFSAAWLEGMYLGANSSSEESKLTPRLIEQMTILDNIIKAISSQNDPSLDVTFLVDGLTDLKNTFESFAEVKSLENTDVELSDVVLTKEELATLTEKITALRMKVING